MIVRLFAFCLFFAAAFAAPAQAQFSFGGDEDILIDAVKATYKGQETILEGSVDVRQGTAQIFSDIMHIYREKAAPTNEQSAALGVVTRIEAEGNFKYITPDSTVTGQRGVYERITGIITITGNVKVVQASGNVANTDKLIYDVKTETIRFTGNCLGKRCKNRSSIRIGER